METANNFLIFLQNNLNFCSFLHGKRIKMLFLETFYDRNENQSSANEERSKSHAVYAFRLCEDNKANQCPKQHNAGHLEF